MEVILLERIEKIGKLGDVVKVKDGFARNYLLPQKKALRANKENIAIYEKQKKIYEEKNAALLKEVQSIAKNMTNLSISIRKQASESGQLYGSVAAREIADTIKLKGHDIQTKQIQLNSVIKNILSSLTIFRLSSCIKNFTTAPLCFSSSLYYKF